MLTFARREILFYKSSTGDCPVKDFLNGLGGKQAQKVVWVLRLVKELPSVPQQYLKKLGHSEDIWEVRAAFAGEAFRLLGFWDEGRRMVLTNAFAKRSQKTPEREIEIAEQRKHDYLTRKLKP
jgi:phage-related protein